MRRKLLLNIALLLIFAGGIILAQGTNLSEERKKQLIRDHNLFNSAQGREFFIAIPPNEEPNYQTNVLEIYVTAAKKTSVTLESQAMGVYRTKPINPFEITTFSSATGELSFMWEVRESERVLQKGLRLISDQPLSVYVLNAKTYTSEGFLAIPTSAWGNEYLHCSYYDHNEVRPWASGFIVIGAYDNTKIRIELRGRGKEYATTAGGRRIGETIRETIFPYDVYMVKGDAKTRGTFDLTGSRVVADKPIGLISFHERTHIPAYNIWNGRDHLAEMIPPVHAWGKKYITIEYKRDKGQGDFFRVVASEPNTKFSCVYYDLQNNRVLGNWGYTIPKAGDFAEYLEAHISAGNDLKSIRGASIFTADKPILVMQYSYSADWDGATVFDPFMILVVPREQYIPATVFQTPANKAFVDNWFNIIAVGDTNDTENKLLQSVTIDGKPVHVMEPSFLYNRIPTTDLYWAKVRVEPGAHVVKGNTKFGGYIYGFSNWDSYGWPAAMAINKLDETDTLEPQLYFTEKCGNYVIRATELRNGAPTDDPRQVDQGIADVQLLSGSYNYELYFRTKLIAWPPLYDYTFELKVQNLFLPAKAILAVTDRAGNVAIDSVYYEPDNLELEPAKLVFGDVRVRTSKEINAKLINRSSLEVKVVQLQMKKNAVFRVVKGNENLPIVLKPGEIHDITVRYTPTRESRNERDLDYDTLLAVTDCLEFTFPAEGRGVLPRIFVEDWDAGAIPVGKTVCKTQQTGRGLKIENRGTMDLIITQITGVKEPFSLSTPTNPMLPIRLKPNEIVFLREVCFTANNTLRHTIDVTFHSNAEPEGSDSVSTWIGSGLRPGPYITDKDWERRRVKTINDSVVVIRNASETKTPVMVLDVNLETPNPNFRIDKSRIRPPLPFNLPAEDSDEPIKEIIVPVIYEPVVEGYQTVNVIPVFQDPTIEPGSVVGKLEGFGFLPKIEVTGYEFQPPILVGNQHPDIGYITIKSTSETADLYIQEIKWNPSSLHPADFAWDMTQNPVLKDFVIPMGETVKIPVIFTAKGVLERRATVDVISDAAPGPNPEPRVTTNADVVGYGFETGITVTHIDYGSQLMCDNPIETFRVTNLSSTTAAQIERFEWVSGDIFAFELLDNPPITLPAKGYHDFRVKFKPDRPGNFAAQLRVYSDVSDTNIVIIKGSAFNVDVNLSLPILRNMAPGMKTVAPPYKDFPVIARSNYWGYANITSFEIELKYKNTWLMWNGTPGSAIRKGEILDGTWTVTGEEVKDPISGISTLIIRGQGTSPIRNDGNLVYPDLLLLLADTNRFIPEFGNVSFKERDICVVPKTSPGEIELATCVQDLRNVVFSKSQFFLQSIDPNPVGSEGFKLKFGVAFEGQTRIELVNSNGEIVRVLQDGIIQPGHYEKFVPTSDLNSGIYFIRMSSGIYNDFTRLVIAK